MQFSHILQLFYVYTFDLIAGEIKRPRPLAITAQKPVGAVPVSHKKLMQKTVIGNACPYYACQHNFKNNGY